MVFVNSPHILSTISKIFIVFHSGKYPSDTWFPQEMYIKEYMGYIGFSKWDVSVQAKKFGK